jgi:Fe-Mn family superoxide dismutase
MFELPKLIYSYDALEPYIDSETVRIHHDKHHQTYVDKLNAAVENDPSLANRKIEEILSNPSSIKEEIRNAVINNGGGHLNHSIYWESMSSNSQFDPKSDIGTEIIKTFGPFDSFKENFSSVAAGKFGSGWAWLVADKGKLEIVDTQNQDTPISSSKKPIFCIDVWEHAYYLKYQNKRAAYIEAWWNIVNWDKAEENFKRIFK